MADEILIQYWDEKAQCTRVRVADPQEAAELKRAAAPDVEASEGGE